MSNIAYPIGSVHRSRNLWEELPREYVKDVDIEPPRLFIGCFWALAVEIGFGLLGWLFWQLSR